MISTVAGVDMHQHLWPERVLDVLRRRRRPPRLDGSTLELDEGRFELDLGAHQLARRLRELDRRGIDVAVVSLQPTLGDPLPAELVDAYHEGILEVSRQSENRIRPLAAGAVLDSFAGTCLAASDLLVLDAAASVLDELERAGGFLFVHPGPARPHDGGPGWWTAGVDYPAQMLAAFGAWLAGGSARWPRIPVVFAILAGGAPFQLERLAARGLDVRVALQADVYFDTASYGRRALELCLATYGVRHIVYGSDTPVIDPTPTLRELQTFGDAVTEAVCVENPARLLA
jgi:6-methylsalicylate decarboxylase